MSFNNPRAVAQNSRVIRVALITDDVRLQTAFLSLINQQDAVEIAPLATAEVALWDPGPSWTNVESLVAVAKDELTGVAAPTLALLPTAPDPETQLRGARALLDSGATGVLLRDTVGDQIVTALRTVRGGLSVLDPSLASAMAKANPPPSRQGMPPLAEDLTNRERQVVLLMADGLSNKQIAGELEISEHTAKFHIGRILEKLDAETRTEAVVRALRYGVVPL